MDQNTTLSVGFGPAKASVPEGMNTRLVSEETALNLRLSAGGEFVVGGRHDIYSFNDLPIFTIDECGA